MLLVARPWLWLVAVMLIAGGCATFDAGEEPQTETIGFKSANEPASLADAAAADRSGDDAATVHVSDQAASPASHAAPAEYRSAAAATPRTGSLNVPATANAAAQRVPSDADDAAAAFEQLMAEARRRGELTAAEEAAFRRDLAAMPAELQPQMAAMLLAVRNRQSESTAANATANMAASAATLQSLSATNSSTALGATDAATLTTAQRLAKITSPSAYASPAAAPELDHNPLRALASPAQTDAAPSHAAANDLRHPLSTTTYNGGVLPTANLPNGSNAPAELTAKAQSPATPRSASPSPAMTSWPDSTGGKVGDHADVDRDIRNALHRDATAARTMQQNLPTEEWQVMLSATTRSLEAKLAETPEGEDKQRREALLRLLYLAAGRLNDAARPVSGDPHEQQFWIDWLYGTSVYLDRTATTSDAQRAAVAADRLREAVNRLGEQANLVVGNLTFCRRVTSFGVYEPFTAGGVRGTATATPQYEFAPNQEVLLYAEVQNFTSVHTEKGYHTLLRPSYQIFDAQGRRLGSVVELDESHDYCQRPRTDFFVCYHIYLPTRIDPGAYRLKLTIEDVHGRKVQENSVDFSIKGR